MTFSVLCDFQIIKYQNLKCESESDIHSVYNKVKNLFENGFCEEIVFNVRCNKYKFVFFANKNQKVLIENGGLYDINITDKLSLVINFNACLNYFRNGFEVTISIEMKKIHNAGIQNEEVEDR